MNRVTFSGRLTEDPVMKKTSSGKSVCTVTIACNEGYGEKQVTVYPKIVLWQGTADYICKYGKKGMFLEMTGRLAQRSYEKDGKKVRVEEYNADFAQLIFDRSGNNGNRMNHVTAAGDRVFASGESDYGDYGYYANQEVYHG